MGFYAEHILPPLLHLAMRQKNLRPYRERVIGQASGRVLEVGVGPGLNLPLYGPSVHSVAALDPSPPLLWRARDQAALARRLRRRRIVHAARLDVGAAFQTFQSRNLVTLLRYNPL